MNAPASSAPRRSRSPDDFTPTLGASPLRSALRAATRRPEPELLAGLLTQARLDPTAAAAVQALAMRLARTLRDDVRQRGRAGLVRGLLQEFALSSHEGVALMCLAEALLRIPDAATRDALIRDKVGAGDWQAHLGHSPSLFVNAAAWGLLLTGKLVATHSDAGLGAALRRLVHRGGEPLVRTGVDLAMRMMGEQFVAGETIAQALANARRREDQGFRYSYDMLGEAAMTTPDAERYAAAYEEAIRAIGEAAHGRGLYDGPGVSIKLSALHPRYGRAQLERVHGELYPRLLRLVQLARERELGINVDAEEADRLDVSLELLERLCFEPSLAGWDGIGFVIQAYQKRCPALIGVLVDLARRSNHRLMVRLCKGAYWDGEIKRAQLDGLDDYPVYTRKAYTDIAYIACARRLLAAPDAVYPQFATHNARTLATIHELAGPDWAPDRYEFQCLHGMGEPLYEQVVGPIAQGRLDRPCRIYAPVGTHETLLAYLVRRLLENGANASFVHRIAEEGLALDALVEDPVASVERIAAREGAIGLPHPAIPLPRALFGSERVNSRGVDLADEARLEAIGRMLADGTSAPWTAAPTFDGDEAIADDAPMTAGRAPPATVRPVPNPADRGDFVGWVREADAADVPSAIARAVHAAPAWAATPPDARAGLLERAADLLEADTDRLIGLLVREAGKTCASAVGEVREAVDFLRYYAARVRREFANDTHRPLGPVVCISPWNFPLAIFTGQVAAALAAGNPVLAKPAEQTPLVAAQSVRAMHGAGVPREVLQLLPGRGETVGAALVADARIQGVLFTGSTDVARLLQRALAGRLRVDGRPVPLIAETGGQNAMIVDSSALAEQVVADVLASAFDSAGQRCSALRVLCLQHEIADRVLEMLEGAMRELRVGNPAALAVDVGPVIDADAQDAIQRHIDAMRARGHRVAQPRGADPQAAREGAFVAPSLIEIDRIDELRHEVFGPVLHVLRYPREGLDALLAQIDGTGYALTLGVHTRIDETIARVAGVARAGNVYVNRNMIGAVVGVQPFGGEGLSGTGPKAGGPLYLLRLLSRRPDDAAMRSIAASGVAADDTPVRALRFGAGAAAPANAPLAGLRNWATEHGHDALAATCARFAAQSPAGLARLLPGPTGQADLYTVHPRDAVLCLADDASDRLVQLAAVLAVGSRAVWPAPVGGLVATLPAAVRERITLVDDWTDPAVRFDAVLHHGDADARRDACTTIAALPGPIRGIDTLAPGETAVPLERLVVERALSVNTAAAGGNAALMTLV